MSLPLQRGVDVTDRHILSRQENGHDVSPLGAPSNVRLFQGRTDTRHYFLRGNLPFNRNGVRRR